MPSFDRSAPPPQGYFKIVPRLCYFIVWQCSKKDVSMYHYAYDSYLEASSSAINKLRRKYYNNLTGVDGFRVVEFMQSSIPF